MDRIYKVTLKEVSAKLAGYKKITPAVIRKLFAAENLLFNKNGSHCCLRIASNCCAFATVNVKPEVYCMADEPLRKVHGLEGFCFSAWIAYIAEDWVLDLEHDYVVVYVPFSNELTIIPAEFVTIKPLKPWYMFWQRKCVMKTYLISEENGVRFSRDFLVRGDTLVAMKDELGCRNGQSKYVWVSFAPLYFVYHPLLSREKLVEMGTLETAQEEK